MSDTLQNDMNIVKLKNYLGLDWENSKFLIKQELTCKMKYIIKLVINDDLSLTLSRSGKKIVLSKEQLKNIVQGNSSTGIYPVVLWFELSLFIENKTDLV